MSDLEKTVKIIFEGDYAELSGTLTNVSGKFDALSDIANKVVDPLAKAADAVLKVDAALAALTVGGLVTAIKQSSEFNSGFAQISTSVDATGQDLETFRKNILDYSTTSTKSIADINAAIYTAAQAGVKYGDALEFISQAEKLAVANKADLNTTVDLLTGTMNAYGYKISDVSKLNDILFTSTLIGKQTIDELGQSMGQVVGIAANSGVSFEELSAAIATLTAKGMNTADAITAVKAVITTIISPSDEAAKAAQSLGLNFSASSLKAETFSGMLTKIMTATGGSTDKMALLFNEVRAMNGALSLTGDGMEFFTKATNETINSMGNCAAAWKKMVDTFDNQAQMIVNSAKVMLIEVGTKLEPMAANISGSLSTVLAGIRTGVAEGAFDPLFKVLEEYSADLSTWLAGVAKALPEALKDLDFSKLVSSIKELTKAFASYFDGMDLTTVSDLHDFIQKLIDGFSGLIKVTSGMVEAFKPYFTAIKDFLLGMAEGDEEAQKMSSKLLILAKVFKEMGAGVLLAMEGIDKFGVSCLGVFNLVAGGVQIVWNFIEQLVNLAKIAALTLTGKLSEIPAVFQAMREDGADAVAGVQKIIKGFEQLEKSSSDVKTQMDETSESFNEIPTEKKTSIIFTGTEDLKKEIAKINLEFVKVEETAKKALAPEKTIVVGYIEDGDSKTAITQAIKTSVPDKKKIDVTMDTATVKKDSDVIKEAIQWKAKLDMAEIEAGVKKFATMFESIDTGIKSTGDLMSDLFSDLNDATAWNRSEIEDAIKAESEYRKQEFDLQKELTEQQIALNKLKLEALEKGSDLGMKITISSSGLEPHLENILWEILKKIQVRANATAAEFLLGVNT
jgi:TP901 family phage tail tape measure protein